MTLLGLEVKTSLGGVTAADFDEEAKEVYIVAVMEALQDTAGVQLRRSWLVISSVTDITGDSDDDEGQRRRLMSRIFSFPSTSKSSKNKPFVVPPDDVMIGRFIRERGRVRVLSAGVEVTLEISYIAQAVCSSCESHDMTQNFLMNAFSRNDVVRAVEGNLKASNSSLSTATVQGVEFGDQIVLASPTYAPTEAPPSDFFDPALLSILVVVPVLAYLSYEYVNHKRRLKEKEKHDEEMKDKIKMKSQVFYDEESGLFSLGPDPAGPETVPAAAGGGAGGAIGRNSMLRGILPMFKRSRKRRVAPDSVEAMVAYTNMEKYQTNWLYKVAPDPVDLPQEESKHCSGDDPNWQDAFDILVTQVARGEFKDNIKAFISEVATDALREETHDQKMQKKSTIASAHMLNDFTCSAMYSEIIESLVLETHAEECEDAEKDYRAALAAITVFKEFRLECIEAIALECLAEESDEAHLLNQAAVAAQVVLKESYRELVNETAARVLLEEQLAQSVSHEAVHGLLLWIVEEEHDSGHFAIPDMATLSLHARQHRTQMGTHSTAASSSVMEYNDSSGTSSIGALRVSSASLETSTSTVSSLTASAGSGMSVDDYHSHVMRAADTHIRRKVAYHKRMLAEKREARSRAKEDARATVRNTSSASSYLRKKAGHKDPEEERKEATRAKAVGMSSYLAKRKEPGR